MKVVVPSCRTGKGKSDVISFVETTGASAAVAGKSQFASSMNRTVRSSLPLSSSAGTSFRSSTSLIGDPPVMS
ncbi:hypothetical protein WMF18_29095 [Sorangium sp. So ce315]|uniref:hypothetical protein n=1 Tax=Sorangium sp. So ce315 TaxID=3133299 RepID=UPI003F5F78A4